MYTAFDWDGVRYYTKTAFSLKAARHERRERLFSATFRRAFQLASALAVIGLVSPMTLLFT